ncbi:MAG: GIY-YIG nuclease family protein [Bacteroidia bacterium]
MYYVYIIFSESGYCYYKGVTNDPLRRLDEHNQGISRYTSKFNDWKLVYLEMIDNKRQALIREKAIKKYSKRQINELIQSSKNQLNIFLNIDKNK